MNGPIIAVAINYNFLMIFNLSQINSLVILKYVSVFTIYYYNYYYQIILTSYFYIYLVHNKFIDSPANFIIIVYFNYNYSIISYNWLMLFLTYSYLHVNNQWVNLLFLSIIITYLILWLVSINQYLTYNHSMIVLPTPFLKC